MSVTNLATRYSSKVAERFQAESYTKAGTSDAYKADFIGAKTVKIYSVDTSPLRDYDANAPVGQRYGNPENLGDTVQELTMRSQPSFTYVIDKSLAVDQPSTVKQAVKTLKRQVDEKVTPHVDRYNLREWAKEGGIKVKETAALTKANVTEAVLAAGEMMDDNMVPRGSRVLFCKPQLVKNLKLSPEFLGTADMVNKVVTKGTVGEIDGMKVVAIPRNYWPLGVNFIITYKDVSLDPMKLEDYKVHDKPQGVAGALVEGLVSVRAQTPLTTRQMAYMSLQAGMTLRRTVLSINLIKASISLWRSRDQAAR